MCARVMPAMDNAGSRNRHIKRTELTCPLILNFLESVKPKLLISIISGTGNFEISDELKKKFRCGLWKVVETTDACILTHGTKAGVVKLIYDMEHRCSASDRDAYEHSYADSYADSKHEKEQCQYSSPGCNHLHCTCDQKSVKSCSLRKELEKKIAESFKIKYGDEPGVVVLLVIEGGPETLETVKNALENNIPVVIINGSGKAADILAFAYMSHMPEAETDEEKEFWSSLYNTAHHKDDLPHFAQTRDDKEKLQEMIWKQFGELENYMDIISSCLLKSKLMSVFSTDEKGKEQEMDICIFQAVLNANREKIENQLQLAFAWNRVDFLETYIFEGNRRYPLDSLNCILSSAINQKRDDFAKILLRHGASLHILNKEKKLLKRFQKPHERWWNPSYIRNCSCFIPKDDIKKKEKCQCGYKFDDHSQEVKQKVELNIKNGLTRWNFEQHSVPVANNAFGEIEFASYNGNVGKYIKVDMKTKFLDILRLLMNDWNLDKPNLLIVVTGGSNDFNISKRLKEMLHADLMKTASTTGAWILTGGAKAGLKKHIGEAIKETETSKCPVVSISIDCWGHVQNRKSLINENCTGLWPAKYRMSKEKAEGVPLDPNHSHFILVDGEDKPGMECHFQDDFIKKFTKYVLDPVSVPLVYLVVGEGHETLETVFQAIKKLKPVVIVKGYENSAGKSRKTAVDILDDFKTAVDNQAVGNTNEIKETILQQFQEEVKKAFDEISSEACKAWMKDLVGYMLCYLTIYKLDAKENTEKMDAAILNAVLNGIWHDPLRRLQIVLTWNRIDLFEEVYHYNWLELVEWYNDDLHPFMFSALKFNRVDFVEKFHSQGVNLTVFLTDETLENLYKMIPEKSILYVLLANRYSTKTKEHGKTSISPKEVDDLIKNCLKCDSDNSLTKTDPDGNTQNYSDGKKQNKQNCQATQDRNHIHELFLWAVLMSYQEIAKYFWSCEKNVIASALVANTLIKKAVDSKCDDVEVKAKLQNDMKEWLDLAIGVLNDCHITNDQKAQDLLVHKQKDWYNLTCMTIAITAKNREFIFHPTFQNVLTKIWMGHIHPDIERWRLLVCVIMPSLAIWLKFAKYEENYYQLKEEASSSGNAEDRSANNTKELSSVKTTSSVVTVEQPTTTRRNHSTQADSASKAVCYSCGSYYCQNYHSMKKFFCAPVITFMYNLVSYLVFLALFTYVLILDYQPNASKMEFIIIGWVVTIFAEEVRQFTVIQSKNLCKRFKEYFVRPWNIADFFIILLFVIYIVLRFIPANNNESGKVFFALSFILFSLRLLQSFSVHQVLGPKLLMIKKMCKDLLYFLLILVVFVVSYAIASHSILYSHSPLNWYTALAIIRRAYWNIYGELSLSDIEDDSNCTNIGTKWMYESEPPCPTSVGKVFVPILMGVYVLLVNILLLNLLIAMFSNTFGTIQSNADILWSFQRHLLINEYYTRPLLCPPFIIISHVLIIISHLARKVKCCMTLCKHIPEIRKDYWKDFCFDFDHSLVQWEKTRSKIFLEKRKENYSNTLEGKLQETVKTFEDLKTKMDEIHNLIKGNANS